MGKKTANAVTLNLSVSIAGLCLKNPVIAASGTFGYGSEYAQIIDVSRLGGICTKGLTLHPRAGNEGIRVWESQGGLLNSIGLENPGIPAFLEKELPSLRKLGPAVIANLSGSTIEEYAEGAALLNKSTVDMIELNISCPNVKEGGMNFGMDAQAAAEVTSAVRRVLTSKPLMVKLTPNAQHLISIARACVNAGADALSLVNTFKAMAIDVQSRKPVFKNISAGLSGPAIKPIALSMVWELCREFSQAGNHPAVPVIGMGGIANAADALEFILAGAAAVQVGSATFKHPAAMIEIIDGIENYMRKYKFSCINEIVM